MYLFKCQRRSHFRQADKVKSKYTLQQIYVTANIRYSPINVTAKYTLQKIYVTANIRYRKYTLQQIYVTENIRYSKYTL